MSLPNSLPDSLISITVSDNQGANLSERLPVSRDDFLAKIVCWHPRAVIQQWENICAEANARDVAIFLHKLNNGNSALQKCIASWLDYLAQNGHDTLRQQTFLLAKEAVESCVDRASFYFTHMHILMVEHQLLSGVGSRRVLLKT